MQYFPTSPIFPEINPACADITCQNGGSCLYINEPNNAACICDGDFNGESCEGMNTISK